MYIGRCAVNDLEPNEFEPSVVDARQPAFPVGGVLF
jgi:hypothetical protein